MNLADLRDAVVKLLMTDYDYLVDNAEEEVEMSVISHPDWWNENAEPKDLANTLASDDDDE